MIVAVISIVGIWWGITYWGSVSKPETVNTAQQGNGGNSGSSGIGGGSLTEATLPPKSDLSEAEKENLLYMIQEEKLARDVYTYLGDKYNLQVFKNIARAEQTHMNNIALLLDRYGIDNPVADLKPGEFENAKLGDLYNQLINQGSQNEVSALKVGALIEETDIKDLEEGIKATDNEDIKYVYDVLKSGSYSHLRAFVRNLEKYGVDYKPVVLSQAEYDSIIGK